MEFCVISPTAGLEKYAVLSKTHLVLAPQVLHDESYKRFYQDRRSEGDFIILDNGTYEGHRMFHLDVLSCINPQVVVLPDYFLQPWQRTWHAGIAQIDAYEDKYGQAKFEWLYIPQSVPGDLNGFIRSYHEAMDDPRITWIGIPRALCYAITNNPLARVEFARLVKMEHPNIHLHSFGMVNGDVHELPYLAQAGVRSVDSSAPVWRGWSRGVHLGVPSEDAEWDRIGTPIDFSDPDRLDHDWVIKKNLEACGVRIPNR